MDNTEFEFMGKSFELSYSRECLQEAIFYHGKIVSDEAWDFSLTVDKNGEFVFIPASCPTLLQKAIYDSIVDHLVSIHDIGFLGIEFFLLFYNADSRKKDLG